MTQETNTQQGKTQRKLGDKLALEINTRMAVTFGASEQTAEMRVVADIVGLVHFEYLILRLPYVPGLRSRLVGGASVTVRFVSNGEMCGFQAPVITHVAKPSLLLFLEYPDAIEKLALRQHKRVQCALPVQVHSMRGDAQGVIADLSLGGCRMTIDTRGQQNLRQTVAGDSMVLRVPLNSEGMPLTTTCTVRSVSSDPSRLHVGLAFTEADEEFRASLETFLTTARLL